MPEIVLESSRIAVVLIVTLIMAAVGCLWLNRPVIIPVAANPPNDFPHDGFSHETFETLLKRFVDDNGNVGYAAWHASHEAVSQLDRYLAAIAEFSPDSTPERFPTRNDELAYWIYGYNANVIKGVLANWPIASVTDVKAPIEAVKGLGFFYRNRYVFGGKAMSLLAVENNKIRKRYRDPRIHFVLNCASDSCPVLRPELPTGHELERLLAEATREFVSEARNVSVDHERRVIRLSAIFKMYRKDFINDVRASGRSSENGLLSYLLDAAPARLRSELEKAQDYRIEFSQFDWALNDQ